MHRYLTLKQLHATGKYPLSYFSLLKLMKDKDKNGLNKVVSKINGRYFIREDLFDKWIESQWI